MLDEEEEDEGNATGSRSNHGYPELRVTSADPDTDNTGHRAAANNQQDSISTVATATHSVSESAEGANEVAEKG